MAGVSARLCPLPPLVGVDRTYGHLEKFLSPAGLCACVSGARGIPIPIESLREVSAEENEIRLGARTIGRLATTSFARTTAAWLRELAVAPAAGRAGLIETRLETRL